MIKKYEKLICVVILCITFIIIACIAKSAIIQAAKYLSSMAVSIIYSTSHKSGHPFTAGV